MIVPPRQKPAPCGTERAADIMTEPSPLPAVAASQPGSAEFGLANTAGVATTPTQLISFAIGNDQYGVDIMAVREIKGWTEITHLPRQPDYVRGVLNLRGIIVPIIDLRCRFGQGVTEATGFILQRDSNEVTEVPQTSVHAA